MRIIFCENPLEKKTVDEEYRKEFETVNRLGIPCSLIDFETVSYRKDAKKAVSHLEPLEHPCETVYRGWMLKPDDYTELYENLLAKNHRLINDPMAYRNCHYLPESLRFIEPYTPKTVYKRFVETENGFSHETIRELLAVFGNSPVIIKDYVKSMKHLWESACFIPDASDTNRAIEVIENFLSWQDDDLNEGLVVREFVPLEELAVHSKSGMPLKLEYRLFFLDGKPIGVYDYWEEGDYSRYEKPPLVYFCDIAKNVKSRFFTMDVAKTCTGDWIIIELGDAQVSGIPESVDPNDFYGNFVI